MSNKGFVNQFKNTRRQIRALYKKAPPLASRPPERKAEARSKRKVKPK